MHVLPQNDSYAGHLQAPLTHAPAPHVVPQAPQLAESVVGLMQALPHLTSGKGQTHAPALQSDPPPQTLPQAPQLLLSHCVSRQVLPQRA